jgi:hypothetical protein
MRRKSPLSKLLAKILAAKIPTVKTLRGKILRDKSPTGRIPRSS